MDGKILKPELKVPEQKTASLSFCDTTPKAFRVWADQLPMANTGEASRQLYHAIIELNHLFLSPLQRLQGPIGVGESPPSRGHVTIAA